MNEVNKAFVANGRGSLDDITDESVQEAIAAAREATIKTDSGLVHVLHDVDREMLGTYASKLHWALNPEKHPELSLRTGAGLPFDLKETFAPDKEKNPVKAEIILDTIVRVFSPEHVRYGGHLEANYDASTPQGKAALEVIGKVVSETNKLWVNVGAYEAQMYGSNSSAVNSSFSRIMKHLCLWDIRKHTENINSDPVLSGKGFTKFRKVVNDVVDDVKYAVSNGQPRVPYLQHAFNVMDEFMEEYVRAELGGSDAVRTSTIVSPGEETNSAYQEMRDKARSRAEGLVVDMELLRTVFNRYYDFRCGNPRKYKQDGYICTDAEVLNRQGITMVPAKVLAKTAAMYDAEIKIAIDGADPVDAKKVLGLIGMETTYQTPIRIMAKGSDAIEAVNNLHLQVRTGLSQQCIEPRIYSNGNEVGEEALAKPL
jgi:phosphotransferase system HPr (HPr) family protein